MKVYMYICCELSIYEIYAAKIQSCEIVCKHEILPCLRWPKTMAFFCLLTELAELLQTFFGMFDRSVS